MGGLWSLSAGLTLGPTSVSPSVCTWRGRLVLPHTIRTIALVHLENSLGRDNSKISLRGKLCMPLYGEVGESPFILVVFSP